MSEILAAIKSLASELFPGKQGILVSVSGGSDSMVLLYAMHEFFGKKRRLIVGHFNHHLRGNASQADQRLVERTAKSLGHKIISGNWARNEKAIQQHGLEMAAREARLSFLASIAHRHRCKVVTMGHHRDDQAETFLWRMMRGAGGIGLGGMNALEKFPSERKLLIARPLLQFAKSELQQFALAKKIPFREDMSNLDERHFRNRIRNKILPMMREVFQPGIERAIVQSAELVRTDSEFVRKMARDWIDQPRGQSFQKLDMALQRWVVWHHLIDNDVTPTFEMIEFLRRNLDSPLTISPTQTVSINSQGELHILYTANTDHDFSKVEIHPHARWTEEVLGKTAIRCRVTHQKPRRPLGELLDAGRVGKQVILRHWLPGDRFEPIGLGRSVKLQDLFTNAKVPAKEKRKRVLACTESGDIFWVQGLRIGELAKVRTDTRRFLRWNWQEL